MTFNYVYYLAILKSPYCAQRIKKEFRHSPKPIIITGAIDRSRTCGLLLRRQPLYPSELQPQLLNLL